MRNLMIFTVVMCLLDGIYNVSTANYSFNKSIDSNYGLKYSESILSNIYSGEQMAEYNRLKEEAIREARGKLNTYLILFELGVTAVYLAVLPFEKKRILKYIGYGGYYD